jgi:mycoredoxin
LRVDFGLIKNFKCVCFLLGILILSGCLESSSQAPNKYSEKYGDAVVLYATNWCGYCQRMREFFAENKIDYIEHDVEASEESYSEFKELGGKGVPLVLVNGRVVRGYAPKAVAQLLNSSGSNNP